VFESALTAASDDHLRGDHHVTVAAWDQAVESDIDDCSGSHDCSVLVLWNDFLIVCRRPSQIGRDSAGDQKDHALR
jgi:hypothetical protein